MSTLSVGIIVLKDYVVDPLVGIVGVGRHSRLVGYVSRVGLGRAIVSIGYGWGFRYCECIGKGRKGPMT